MIDIHNELERLINYGLNKNLLSKEDAIYSRNAMLALLKLDEFQARELNVVEKQKTKDMSNPAEILETILDWASENNLLQENSVTYRDLFDTALMDSLMARPSEIIKRFNENYKENPVKATDEYYKLSRESHYIRMDRIEKNVHWYAPTEYGDLEVTINLSKPEKDPVAIAAAKHLKSSSYPKCLLCAENEGYAGRVNHPARQNLRLIPVELTGEKWFLQYSPYVYYNEHSIIFSSEHVPMKISKNSIGKLLEFVEKFPHYFVGSNADLPIVGGSILSHDHFQGGRHEFPMAKAPIEKSFTFDKFPGVKGGIVKWPMSVIRINSKDRVELLNLAEEILNKWRAYSDLENDIVAFSGDEPHNTITPIARKRGDLFELDLVLRNNRVSEEHPLGIFHPHTEVHNIKKENIGLIEVMGLAILPGRLKEEIEILGQEILKPNCKENILANTEVSKHINLVEEVLKNYSEINSENINMILKEEIGKIFLKVLEHAGVFKQDEKGQKGIEKFINTL